MIKKVVFDLKFCLKKPIDFSKKDIKNAKYTYDFDGQLINTKSVKTERLPPTAYAIK